MHIGEVAQRAGVNPKTIRFYEDIGVLPPAERTRSGYRSYGEADLDRLTFVKRAQRLGLTLDEIREILVLRERGERPCQYVRGVLQRERAAIDRRIAELKILRAELAALETQVEALSDTDGGVCKIIEHVRDDTTAQSRTRRPGKVAAIGATH